MRERKPPFSPAQVVTDFAADLKAYGLSNVTGDRWGRRVRRASHSERRASTYSLAEKVRSDLYRDLLPP